jgi:cytochrome c553
MNKIRYAATFALCLLIPSVAFSAGNAAEGQRKSVVCHACHGGSGKAMQPIYPNLAGQHQDYLSKTLYDFRDGSRQNVIMNGFAANLSDDDIEDIAAWYASRKGLVEIQDK